jgi:ankyrin repeat protein
MQSLLARLHGLAALPPPLEQTRSTARASGTSPPRSNAVLEPLLGRGSRSDDESGRPGASAPRVGLERLRAPGDHGVPAADPAAARRADANKLQVLLAQHPELLTTGFENKASLLTEAARLGNLASVRALLIHAARAGTPRLAEVVNHRDAHGKTALAQAIEHGHLEVATALLENAQTDANLANRLLQTPLHLAARRKDPRFADALLRHSLIEPGLPDLKGNLPLHVAIGSDNSEVAVMIAGHRNALPDQPNADGRTPLEAAVRRSLPDVVDALLKNEGVDPSRPGPHDETPLWQLFRHRLDNLSVGAVYEASSESWTQTLCKFVASPRIDANAQGPDGETILTKLCKLGRRPPHILSQPMDILMDMACSSWRINTVKAVLASSERVDLGARNRGGQTPHDVAMHRGDFGLARVLSEQGAVRGTADRASHEQLLQA